MSTQYDDYLEDQAAEGDLPFAGAAIQQETLAALQNVIEAMTSDRECIAALSEANAAVVSTNSNLTIQLKAALKKIEVLTTRVDKLEKQPSVTPSSCRSSINSRKYCYTCGIQRDHTSRACTKGVSGHKVEAT